MNKIALLFIIAVVFLAGFYFFVSRSNKEKAGADYKVYCGSCHIPPDPKHLTQHIWKEKVLPEMGARLGINTPGYNPYKNMSFHEQYRVRLAGVYPTSPQISEKKWNRLKEYIIDKAPENAEYDKTRRKRNSTLSQFKPRLISLDDKPGAFITCINYNRENQSANIGDAYGNIYKGSVPSFSRAASVTSPVVSIINKDSVDVITGIGSMSPTEMKTGKIFRLQKNGVAKLEIDTLHRPAFVEMADLNREGTEEMIVCEYGNKTGQLTLFHNENFNFIPETLIQVPGTIRVIVEDMDNNGKEDLVVLQTKGDEGIIILYQEDQLKFRAERAIRLSPALGSSWFELIDYEGDGDKDIVLVNGNETDFSFMPKSYHGLRLFLNSEEGFTEAFFYPIYGATRVAASDFDLDGDIDFAVCSSFPDYESNPEESFVYLENTDAEKFKFNSYTFEEAVKGRWMVMDQGDMDNDGDIDLLLGSLIHTPTPTPEKFSEEWKKTNVDLIFLENLRK